MIGCTHLHGRPDALAAQKYLVRTHLDRRPSKIGAQTEYRTLPTKVESLPAFLPFGLSMAAFSRMFVLQLLEVFSRRLDYTFKSRGIVLSRRRKLPTVVK